MGWLQDFDRHIDMMLQAPDFAYFNFEQNADDSRSIGRKSDPSHHDFGLGLASGFAAAQNQLFAALVFFRPHCVANDCAFAQCVMRVALTS